MTGIMIFFGLVALFIIWMIAMYNSLVRLKVKIDNSWSDIKVFLKKRFDLIPNLVNTVKGYAEHEKSTFEAVTNARTAAMNVAPNDIQAQTAANKDLAGALGRLFALAENYPDLKANTNFLDLQTALQNIEGDLGNARRYYNATVRDFNTAIQQFPAVVIAGMLGFTKREFFELENPDEAKNVEVKF
ncbi:MAG TPA: LemA family protein [Ginsengibacter sp.]|nr:LemA family protein [Ginsengibacter sp.]HRP45387.1 LemA family protein [Ginsengibacter sp.]